MLQYMSQNVPMLTSFFYWLNIKKNYIIIGETPEYIVRIHEHDQINYSVLEHSFFPLPMSQCVSMCSISRIECSWVFAGKL